MKKTLALVTLVCFLVFTCSCAIHSWKKTPLVSIKPEKRTTIKISAVQVHSGQVTGFSKKPAAYIQEDSVLGTVFVEKRRVETSQIKKPLGPKWGGGYEITTTDGISYTTTRVIARDDSGVTFDGYYQVSVPLEDIAFIWIRKVNVLATVLLYAVPIGGAFALMAAAMHGFSVMGGGVGGWFSGPW